MSDLAILVPVLRRPQNVKPLLDSIRGTAPEARTLFICDPDDDQEQAAIVEAHGQFLLFGGNYAAKTNEGVRATAEPLLFFAADDLRFHPGWLEAARERLSPPVGVVGVNDLIPRPQRPDHATHFLMSREYAERPTIDGRPGPLCEAYDHNFCDDEFMATAKRRGAYAYAADAHVQHLHPMNATAPDDEIYRKGRSRFRMDRKLFRRRERLWT